MASSARIRRRRGISATLLVPLISLGLLGAPGTALAAAPATPTLVAPAADATGVPSPVELRVRADDPDGGPLQVRYFGRVAAVLRHPRRARTSPSRSSRHPELLHGRPPADRRPRRSGSGQPRRARPGVRQPPRRHRRHPTNRRSGRPPRRRRPRWTPAGVPNSVLPGNHDNGIATGEATEYRQYFPVTRYGRPPGTRPTPTAATSARTSSAPTRSTGRTSTTSPCSPPAAWTSSS